MSRAPRTLHDHRAAKGVLRRDLAVGSPMKGSPPENGISDVSSDPARPADGNALLAGSNDGLPQPRRTWAAISIWLAMSLAVLDNAIIALALPTLGQSFATSPAATIWVVSGYQIAVAMVLLPLSSLSEIVGHRTIYLAGLALFTAASIACGIAPDLIVLTIGRFVQGFGAAAIMGVNAALIRATYPSTMLGRAIGYNALVVAICSAAGPSLAGAILTRASWHWLFIINVPIGAFAFAISAIALPRPIVNRRRFDGQAAFLSAVAFGAFFLAMTNFVQGPPTFFAAGELALAVLAGGLLVRRARGQNVPLLPLDLIGDATLRLSYAASIAAFSAMSLILIASPFALQHVGFDAAMIGLLISPMPIGLVICAPVAGWLADRYAVGALGAVGMAVFVTGALVLAVALWSSTGTMFALEFAAGMAGCGLGFGLFQTPNNRTMIGSAPAERMGAAAGMQAISRTIGQLTGAVLTAGALHFFGQAAGQTALLAAALAMIAGLLSVRRLKLT